MKDGGSQAASEVVSEPAVNGVASGTWPVPDANTTSPADGESDNSQSMFEVLRPDAVGLDNDNEQREGDVTGDLNGTLMRTLVSNGNDALKLLFQAALENRNGDSPAELSTINTAPQTVIDLSTPKKAPSVAAKASELTVPSPKTLRMWNAFRFTKMGWFSSEEAFTYMDLFFKHLAPLSLVSRNFNPSHDAHFNLITQEPLLCCVILLISSRYHVLPGTGGIARSTLIHQRLWEHCQHLILRIIFGQEKRSKAKTRTIGSIEALLLMVEWHSRAIHFPPGADGWDSSLLLTEDDPRDTEHSNRADKTDEINVKWFRDIVAPAKTSDRMSWMLLGCAQSLSLELGLFNMSEPEHATTTPTDFGLRPESVCQLLYILVEQHSNRLGCASMMPAEYTPVLSQQHRLGDDSSILSSWLDLTNISRTVNDMLFPSPMGTRELLRNGRYTTIVRRFRHQLRTWKYTYIEPTSKFAVPLLSSTLPGLTI
ncbi:Transcriptional activator ARO80 [Colletotrichum siamense]|uniref:Transcriptional activator ARO80 n=1 Tax=Colletotrichum siamense TaxID=690259 RepID=A0A9P5F699_COLSI|nr:Transcriptional activator ARO80 [Colletotrichum siamense]KAF4867317.1 Transcriptional activator ARO80 [Colletotrichum siamense]